MTKSTNIDNIIALYWEGDRTAVKKRYEDLFRGLDDSNSALSVQVPEEESPADSESVDVPDVADSDSFDDEWLVVQVLSQLTEPICEMLEPHWRLLNDRMKIVALHFFHSFIDAKDVDFHAMEGLVRLFGVEASSHYLHALAPGAAFPISTELSYLSIRSIFGLYGIEFDDHKDLDEFAVWQNISMAVSDYCKSRNLEPWQFWALIYDLGPRLIPKPGPYPTDEDPRVWIVATNDCFGEFEAIDAHGSENVGTWAINKRARRGDLALMYCVSPRSAIVSLYRVVGDAHYDPFGGWNGYRAEIAEKISLPWIRYSEMKKDVVLKEWTLVKGNFQGLLHFEMPHEMWQRLNDLIGMKDADSASRLEQFAKAAQGVRMIKVANESWSEAEVEEKLVIPLMQELGWVLDKTLDRQVKMSVKIGSGKPKGVLADFVGYRAAIGSESRLVVEVKRQIRNAKALTDAVEQAESYASKLRCTRFAVASPEGLWIYDLRFPGQSSLVATVQVNPVLSGAELAKVRALIGFEALNAVP